MILLISKLDDHRIQSIAFRVAFGSLDPGHVQNDRITRLQTTQHTLKIGERSHRNAIDAIDYVAFDERLSATGSAQFRNQSVRIDVFNIKTLNTGQMSIGEQLRLSTQRV